MMLTVLKLYPIEFSYAADQVEWNREPGVPLERVSADFWVHLITQLTGRKTGLKGCGKREVT